MMTFQQKIYSTFFFGGGIPSDRVYVRRRHRTHHHNHAGHTHQTNAGNAYLVQMLPILILLVVSLLSAFLVQDPAFNLKRTETYINERTTGRTNIKYYVKRDFLKHYSGRVHLVEKEVEKDYLHHLRSSCYEEKYRKENTKQRGRYFGDRKLFEEGNKMKTPSCDKYTELYNLLARG